MFMIILLSSIGCFLSRSTRRIKVSPIITDMGQKACSLFKSQGKLKIKILFYY